MRLALAFVAMLLLFPAHAPAETIRFYYLNSDVIWGPGATHFNYYTGKDIQGSTGIPDEFFVDLGPLTEQQLFTNELGVVVQSNYLFSSGGPFVFGSGFPNAFELPLTSFTIFAPELGFTAVERGPIVNFLGGDLYFTLGPGLLPLEIAQALGVSRNIAGGRGAADLTYTNLPGRCSDGLYGTYLSPHRVACDGAIAIELDVPEPALMLLLPVGLGFVLRRRRG